MAEEIDVGEHTVREDGGGKFSLFHVMSPMKKEWCRYGGVEIGVFRF